MIPGRCFCLASLLGSLVTVSAQNPLLDTPKVSERPAAAPTPPAPLAPLSPEKRADILMARKMYREAAETYKEGPLDSAVIQNKIGIAYHQMLQPEIARRYYEGAIKLDPKYPEAINNLGTIYYAKKSYRRSIKLYHRGIEVCAGIRFHLQQSGHRLLRPQKL